MTTQLKVFWYQMNLIVATQTVTQTSIQLAQRNTHMEIYSEDETEAINDKKESVTSINKED